MLLAILADFEGEPGELIAGKIMTQLEQVCTRKLELSQRAVQLIHLAVLRNLNNTVFNLAKKMAITIDIKEDTLYQLRQEEGKVAAKEEAAVNMLKKGMSADLISEIT